MKPDTQPARQFHQEIRLCWSFCFSHLNHAPLCHGRFTIFETSLHGKLWQHLATLRKAFAWTAMIKTRRSRHDNTEIRARYLWALVDTTLDLFPLVQGWHSTQPTLMFYGWRLGFRSSVMRGNNWHWMIDTLASQMERNHVAFHCVRRLQVFLIGHRVQLFETQQETKEERLQPATWPSLFFCKWVILFVKHLLLLKYLSM